MSTKIANKLISGQQKTCKVHTPWRDYYLSNQGSRFCYKWTQKYIYIPLLALTPSQWLVSGRVAVPLVLLLREKTVALGFKPTVFGVTCNDHQYQIILLSITSGKEMLVHVIILNM